MISSVRVSLFNIVFAILVSHTLLAKGDDALGCQLLPTKTGHHMEQDTLLDYMLHRQLYGKTFMCSSHANTTLVYEFTICGDSVKDKPSATVIRRSLTEGKVEAIGMRNATSVSGKPDEWIYMRFGGGDKDTSGPCINTSLSSSIMILCDKEHTSPHLNLLYEEVSYCHFVFELKMAAICENNEGLGGWTILFIILLVGFSVYFAAGFIYLRFVTGAKGVGQIPNKRFWVMLGNKFADGCNFVCRCNQCCGEADEIHSPYSEYSPIGESSRSMGGSHSSQRDAPLLDP